MRSFYGDRGLGAVPADVVTRLRQVDLGAGRELLHAQQVPALLAELAERARVQSITASSALEGVVVQDVARRERVIQGRGGKLRNRDEQQLAGYRKALDYVFTEDWQPLDIGLVLHVHRLLWSETAVPGGGLKTEDNLVVDRSPDGSTTVRFKPVPAAHTEYFLRELITAYRVAVAEGRDHPVLLVGLFVLDLLVIHPFEDGNGRVARILTNALLAEQGYGVGRWVSLEQLIAEEADDYYATLLASTRGWHEGEADVWPWLTYFVSRLAVAYERLAKTTASARAGGTSKQERVRTFVLDQAPLVFTIGEVRAALPGVSDPTIRLVLTSLRREGRLEPTGTGRSAGWRRLARR